MASSIRAWIIKHDIPLGLSIMSLPPEEAGQRICEKYSIDFEGINADNAEQVILDHLNQIKE